MSPDNIQIVRGIFDAWGRGDFRYGVEHFDADVAYIVRPDFPEFGSFLGLEEVAGFMRRFLEQWERTAVEAEELRAVGDTVLARVLQHSKGSFSGVEGDNRFFMLFTFRGPRIVRVESILREEQALEAVGLSGF